MVSTTLKKTPIPMNDETRIALLEHTMSHIDATLMDIKSDIKIFKSEVNQKFDKFDNKILKLQEDISSNFKFTMTTMFALFSGLYATALGGMVARLCKWI
jgi:hypothetical protein